MTSAPVSAPLGHWTGEWARTHAGVDLLPDTPEARALVGLAVRRNPKRLHLVVSHVLAKHVPVAPSVARAHGEALGAAVEEVLDGVRADLVFGYAETATGLGHLVADRLGAIAIHSTRRPGRSAIGFEEEHSHATSHRLQPADPALLEGAGPLVLVDDELTTGTTILNTVRELHALSARAHYVVATLVDLRPDGARSRMEEVAAELGTRIDVVSLLAGEVHRRGEPDDVVRAALGAPEAWPTREPVAEEVWVDGGWPRGVPTGGRHGLAPNVPAFADALDDLEVAVLPHVEGATHVLGTEELMHLPLCLAERLEAAGNEVTLSSTTRSPVLVVDEPGYAIRHGLRFAAHDVEDPVPRFAYNLPPGRFHTVVLVVDAATPPDGAVELREALRGVCRRLVVARVGE